MHFSLHQHHAGHPDTAAFFRVHLSDWTVYSPLFPDRKSAVAEMEALVLQLRKTAARNLHQATDDPLAPRLTFFRSGGEVVPSYGPLGELESIDDRLLRVRAAAAGNVYRVIAYETLPDEDLPPLAELPGDFLTNPANWQEVGSSLLHITRGTRHLAVKPSIGGQISPEVGPCAHIFNALQPFASTDFALFRGRKRETEEIYSLLQAQPLLLLYGPARVGKTSLLQCGLANRIANDEADLIMIPCGEGAVFDSLDTALQVALTQHGQGAAPHEAGPLALAGQLAGVTPRRQYLVFDQVEDILTADVFDADRAALLGFINELGATYPEHFRIVLSLREEFLAPLAEQETHLPNLLTHRFRLVPLREKSMVNASVNFLDFLHGNGSIAVDDSQAVAERVCRDLADENGNVPAHCLQIYLHQVHQKSCRETAEGPVPINTELLDRFGPPRELINAYYDEQLTALDGTKVAEDGRQDILVQHRMNELRNGRQDCGCGQGQNNVQAAATPVAAGGGWGWLSALLLLPIGALLGWFLLPTRPEPAPTACELLEEQPGDCAAYVSYLCNAADTEAGLCVPTWLATTDLNDCELWRDYTILKRRESCVTYQAFYQKYRDSGVCMDFVQPRLLAWECPLVVDTVRYTVRDTIIERVPATPSTYSSLPNPSPAPAAAPDCETVGTITLKRVGPLFIATEPISGGPYRWEDALTACSGKGLRLPCIGEIDFLIEKIYRDDPDRAYAMLAGAGACNLVNPAEVPEGRIEFWTATEANDAAAWSYFFDTGLKTIGRQAGTPKSARLPCLCVKTGPERTGSALPACYGKQVDRGQQ